MITFSDNSTTEFMDKVLEEYELWKSSYSFVTHNMVLHIAKECKAVIRTDNNGNYKFTYVGI